MLKSEHLHAVLPVIDGMYQRIREIEAEHNIMGINGDYRPRIEYYHDAIRALTSGDRAEDKNSRLSVERLAYDVAMLRHIIAKPLHAGRGEHHFSPHTDVVVQKNGGVEDTSRQIRSKLADLYRDYTVMFVSLLAEKADRNSNSRIEEADIVAQDCAMLQEALKQFETGKTDINALLAAVDHIEHDELRRALKTLIQQRGIKRHETANVQQKLNETSKNLQAENAQLQKAAMQFATGRLAVYEDARETVKNLSLSGLNVAGKFVEQAMQQSQGRGQGRGQW